MTYVDDPTLLEHLLVGILVVIGLYAVLRGQKNIKSIKFDTATRLSIYWSNGVILIVSAAAVLGLWLHAGRPIAQLGLRWGHVGPVAIGLSLVFVVVYWIEAHWRLSGPRRAVSIGKMRQNTPFAPGTPRELRHWVFLAVSAGVCEEIIFRGFLISYCVAFTGTSTTGLALAIIIPGLGFAIVHFYHDLKNVVLIFWLSAVFGTIAVITESLLIPIVLHTAVDLVGGLLTLRFAPNDQATSTASTAGPEAPAIVEAD